MNIITHPTPEIGLITDKYDERPLVALEKLPGVNLVERRNFEEDKKEQKDCIWYVCEKLNTVMYDLFGFFPWRLEGYVFSSKLRPGCPIVYHLSPCGAKENHVGIYLGKDCVESKLGYGHIYRHPINCIPKNFGPYYLACVPALTKDKETTLDNMDLWFDLYQDIRSIQIKFPETLFSKSAMRAVDNAIGALEFLKKAKATHERHGNKAKGTYYISYQVVDNFLDKKEHRDKLRAIYERGKLREEPSDVS